MFAGTHATASFEGAAVDKHKRGLHLLRQQKLFVKYSGIANSAVKAAFQEAGFRRSAGRGWNVLWGAVLKKESYKNLDMFQRVNHFPGTWELGRKDLLYKYVFLNVWKVGPLNIQTRNDFFGLFELVIVQEKDFFMSCYLGQM